MSLRVLIAVKSCARDAENGFNQTIRETWGKDVQGADLRFFLGQGAVTRKDEIVLDCPDDYRSLPYKTKAICQWAWDENYTQVFLADTDTFVMPARLLESGFENYDYAGHFNGHRGIAKAVYGRLYSWAAGGSGYWLSRNAMKIVADCTPDKTAICPVSEVPCEDIMCGQVLGPLIATNAIIVSHDPRYALGFREDYKVEISAHYGSESAERVFDPSWMRRHYEVNR